jgi:putative addiction module component (TIGR02574 family)
MSGAAIQDEILKLSADERARLIEVLWDSRSTREIKEREAAWAGESERRIDAVDSGMLKARDAKTVFSDLRKPLKK